MSRLRFVGPVALCLLIVGGLLDLPHFFRAWLIGWLLWLGAAMGAMAFLMIHHLSGGRWGWPIRRVAEASAATLPFAALAALPLLPGLRHVFPWADADRVARDALLQHRAPAFTVTFALARAAIYLTIWSLLGWSMRRVSLGHDQSNDARALARLRTLSALGLVLYFITMSLASIDWIASREVDWYSSTFGLVTILGQAITGLCVLIIVVALRRDAPAMRDMLGGEDGQRIVHDLGNLLQVTVVLWAYVSFMQYLIQWIGSGQDEAMWFYHRTSGDWNWMGRAIIGLHFAVPFVLLLFQSAKRDLRTLACIAGGIALMRCADLLWTIDPSAPGPEARGIHWLDPVALVAVGWIAWSLINRNLDRMPLAPRAAKSTSLEDEPNDRTDERQLANS